MIVAGIHHVSLNVRDTTEALGFYRDLLGLTEIERPPFPFAGAWLDAGGGRQVHLIEADVAVDLGQHVAFEVVSLDDAVAALRAAGHEVGDPKPVGGTDTLQVFTHDPSGNRIELTKPAR